MTKYSAQFILLFLFCVIQSRSIDAQVNIDKPSINCDSLYNRYELPDIPNLISITRYESPPMPAEGFEKLQKIIQSPDDSMWTESVPFELFVDEKGESPCLPIICCDIDDETEKMVLDELCKLKFTPAMQRGKPVPSVGYFLFRLKMVPRKESANK